MQSWPGTRAADVAAGDAGAAAGGRGGRWAPPFLMPPQGAFHSEKNFERKLPLPVSISERYNGNRKNRWKCCWLPMLAFFAGGFPNLIDDDVCVFIHIYIYTYIYISHMYMYTYIYICICIHTYDMNTRYLHMYMSLCMYNINIHIYICTDIYVERRWIAGISGKSTTNLSCFECKLTTGGQSSGLMTCLRALRANVKRPSKQRRRPRAGWKHPVSALDFDWFDYRMPVVPKHRLSSESRVDKFKLRLCLVSRNTCSILMRQLFSSER